MDAVPTDAERAAVDDVLGPPGDGWAGGVRAIELEGRVAHGGSVAAHERRHLLLPALHALQSRAGWISPGGLTYVSQRLTVPPAEVYGVATFYAMFSTEARPSTVLHICDDIACRVAGAEELITELELELGPDRKDQLLRSPCLGMCEHAPAGLVQMSGDAPGDVAIGRLSTGSLEPFLHGGAWTTRANLGTSTPQPTGGLRLLRRVGVVDPRSLDDYRAHGGYAGLRAGGRARARRGDRRAEDLEAPRTRWRGLPRGREVGGRGRAGRVRRTTSCATPTSPSPGRSRTAC